MSNFFRLSVLVTLINGILICTAFSRLKYTPIQPAKLTVQDGEVLKYNNFTTTGDKTTGMIVVTRVNTNTKEVTLYINDYDPSDKKIHLPSNYSNYSQVVRISLNSASLISTYYDNVSNMMATDKKGMVGQTLVIDLSNKIANYTQTDWDGKMVKTKSSFIKIKPEYPIWDINSGGFIGTRFLDIHSKGTYYTVIPWLMKDPIPVSFYIFRKEKIKVPAGEFNADVIGSSTGDAFIRKLLEGYRDQFLVWKEDGPRGLIVKMKGPVGWSELDSVDYLKVN